MKIHSIAALEWRKTSRRWEFLAPPVLFVLLLGSDVLYAYSRQPARLAFPGTWERMAPQYARFASVFVPVSVVLLVASEFNWRVARQHVIDGMRKSEYLTGKFVVAAFVAGAFFIAFAGSGLAIGCWATPGHGEPTLRAQDVRLLARYLLFLTGYAALGALCATVTRSVGAGLGLYALYAGFGDALIVAVGRALGADVNTLGSHVPTRVFDGLALPPAYSPSGAMTVLGCCYIAVIAIIAAIDFHRRDL